MVEVTISRPPLQETMLMDLIQRLGRLRHGRIGIHFHFSSLSRGYSQERYMRIAVDSLSSYVNGFEGQLFRLENNDVFYIAKDVTRTMLEAAVARIRLLFSQDPLLELTHQGESQFCTWYDLEKEYEKLKDKATEVLAAAQEHKNQAPPPFVSKLKQPTPIQPELLSKLEQLLETVDVTNIARRQTVCTLIDKANPQPLFEEIYTSIADLQSIVAPGIDLTSNTWLFRYLTKTLDHRVMLMLIRDGVTSTRPFSLNLNVDTVLTPEFTKFESVISPQLRGRLVVELNKLDVFSDMNAFLFARDYLHDHGFRLCLDGLTHHTLPYYNRVQLGFDLVKLNWTPNAMDDMLPSMKPEIRNLIMETGQAHTILCRCDNEQAIECGQDLGIVMFQGRHIDRKLREARIPFQSRFGLDTL